MDGTNPGAAQMISVVVADDQTTVRDGLTTVLSLLDDVEVVGEARDGAEAVELVRTLSPQVVLMDLRMPGVDGVAATAAITAAHPGTAVLVLTTYADDASIAGALRAGARGYLTKDAGRAEIAAAVRSVASGHTTLAADVGARLISALGAPASRARADLTDRELDVLRLMAQGRNNAEIAAELFIGLSTVKSHINSLFAKLDVRDRGQAIAYAHRTGLAR